MTLLGVRVRMLMVLVVLGLGVALAGCGAKVTPGPPLTRDPAPADLVLRIDPLPGFEQPVQHDVGVVGVGAAQF